MSDLDIEALGRTPISAEHPTGEDISLDPDYAWMEEEFTKLLDPPVEFVDGKLVYLPFEMDWFKTLEVGSKLLSQKAKDIRVAVWMARALLATDKVKGVQPGLALCANLIEAFDTRLFPSSPNGRAKALDRLKLYLLDSFNGTRDERPLAVGKGDAEALKGALEQFERLDELVASKLNVTVQLTLLRNAIEDAIKKAESAATPAAQPAPAAGPTPAQPAAASDAPPAPAAVATAAPSATYDFKERKDRVKYLNDLKQLARELHKAGIETAPTDPLPYRWSRIVYWSPLDFPPTTQELQLPGPNEQLRTHLAGLYEQRDWQQLLIAGEQQFATQFFWLDLQRYAVESLEQLGAQYGAVRDAILHELTFLLRRMPHFVTFVTRDRVPVANGETQDWLKDVVAAAAEAENAAVASASVRTDEGGDRQPVTFSTGDPLAKVLEQARERLHASPSEREVFVIHLKLSEYLLSKKEVLLAFTYLRGLAERVTDYRLDRWEPALAVQALRLLHDCCTRLGRSRKDDRLKYVELADSLVARVALIDPVVAGKLAGR